jgi:hypothetical protein
MRAFRQRFTVKDAIGSHTCSFEGVILVYVSGYSLLLPVGTVDSVEPLKVC